MLGASCPGGGMEASLRGWMAQPSHSCWFSAIMSGILGREDSAQSLACLSIFQSL